LALEAVAARVIAVEFHAIPTTLQTKPYYEHARQHRWTPEGPRRADSPEADDLTRRQQILTAEPSTRLTWFTDEFAIRRLMATAPRDVVRQQFHRLVRLAESVLDLRIVPAAQASASPPQSFTLIQLDDGHTSTHERTTTAFHNTLGLGRQADHQAVLDRLDHLALDPPDSCNLMQELIPSLARAASTA
jgi:hypothetical protein